MKASQSTDNLVRLVNDIHLSFARLFNHRAAEFGLTRAHWRVLAGLYRHDGPTQTELANTIAMARSPLGKIVDRLEESGLIERRPDPDDRRVKRLHLTKKAEPLVAPARQIATDLEQRALENLSKTKHADLIASLTTVRAALYAELENEACSKHNPTP